MEALLAAPVAQERVVLRLEQSVMARFVGGLGTPAKIRYKQLNY